MSLVQFSQGGEGVEGLMLVGGDFGLVHLDRLVRFPEVNLAVIAQEPGQEINVFLAANNVYLTSIPGKGVHSFHFEGTFKLVRFGSNTGVTAVIAVLWSMQQQILLIIFVTHRPRKPR